MLQLLVIGCGGAVGALMRYGLGWRITLLAGGGFPWGTLFVNVFGCFLAGLILTLFVTRIPLSDLLRNGLQIGLLGGFTTFSAFSIDAITLFDQGLWLRGLLYIVTTVVVSVLGAYLGMSVGRNF
ncbi:MAG TPA: CrcB family protein [Gammaproteobacteria bacterium]|jgi:CrcB protein|nr:CrcB family protein [Gammaproteobacteria bacterium]